MIGALEPEADVKHASEKIREAAGSYGFRKGFDEKVISLLSGTEGAIIREIDFTRTLNLAFYRIALTGVAAIVLLLISMFLTEGSLSFNTFLGMGDTYDESIVYMLTGN